MLNAIRTVLCLVAGGLLPIASLAAEQPADPYIKQAQSNYNQALQQARQEEAPMQQQAVAAQANAIANSALQQPPKAANSKLAPLTPVTPTPSAAPAAAHSTAPTPDNNNWTKPNPWTTNSPNPWAAPTTTPSLAGAQPSNNQPNNTQPSTNQPNAPASSNIYLPPAHK